MIVGILRAFSTQNEDCEAFDSDVRFVIYFQKRVNVKGMGELCFRKVFDSSFKRPNLSS